MTSGSSGRASWRAWRGKPPAPPPPPWRCWPGGGSPFVADDLRAFAERCDVVTFDHEQVDLELVAALAGAGAVFRPGAGTLELAVDKAQMRTVLDAAGVPVPGHRVVG